METLLIENNLLGMPEGNLLKGLGGLMNLTDEFYSEILPMLKHSMLKKVLKVAKQGDICKTAYWIDSGYSRFYKVIYKDGVRMEVTFRIFKPGTIMVMPECFFNGKQCDYYADIMKGSVIVPFTTDNFRELKIKASEAEALANMVLASFNPESSKNNEIINLKPDGRYEQFLEVYGKESLKYCKLKDIASFLLMTSHTLSRIRRRRIWKHGD